MRPSYLDFVGGLENLKKIATEYTMEGAVRGTGFDKSCVRKLAQKYRIKFLRQCRGCLKPKSHEHFNKSASVCFDCRVHVNQRPAGNTALWRQETEKFQYSMAMLKKPWSNAKGPLSYWSRPDA